MPARHIFHVLMLTANPDLVELYRQDGPECVVTIARDAAAALRKAPKQSFDAVIVESRKDWMTEMHALEQAVELAPKMVLVGERSFLRQSTEAVKALCNGHLTHRGSARLFHELGLEDYMAAKLRDFVRRMKLGAGSDLYSLLMKTVEKPLITLVL